MNLCMCRDFQLYRFHFFVNALRSVCDDHVSDVLPSSSIDLETMSTSYACISRCSAICVYERRSGLFQA